jgi:hypothetical protein
VWSQEAGAFAEEENHIAKECAYRAVTISLSLLAVLSSSCLLPTNSIDRQNGACRCPAWYGAVSSF